MSAPWPGSMRGPRVKTPHLLLLLLLLSSLTGTDAEAGTGKEVTTDSEPDGGEDAETPEAISEEPDPTPPADLTPTAEINTIGNEPGSGHTTEAADESDGSGYTDTNTTAEPDEGLNPTIILIPVVLVVVIIGMIVCGIFINRRWNNKARIQELRKEDPYLDGSSTEKVPMPMFEEDVPSVLELEMEELDQWMKKDGGTTEESKHA